MAAHDGRAIVSRSAEGSSPVDLAHTQCTRGLNVGEADGGGHEPLRVLLFLLVGRGDWLYGRRVLARQQERARAQKAGRTLGDARPAFPYTQIDVPRKDAARQFGWVMTGPADEGAWVLYLHGNASTIASPMNISHYREFRTIGLNVLAPEYRGFAGLDGTATEAALDVDARAAYEYLPRGAARRAGAGCDLRLVAWLGCRDRSRNGGRSRSRILEGAPASQAGLSRRRYPFFPVRLLMRNPFDSRSKMIVSIRPCSSFTDRTTKSYPWPKGASSLTPRAPTSVSSRSTAITRTSRTPIHARSRTQFGASWTITACSCHPRTRSPAPDARSGGFRYHPAMTALAILFTTALIALQPSAGSREWFEKTEQTLMDAVASGDHAVWDHIMDDACVMTGEEGEQLTKAAFLKALRPLPQGLSVKSAYVT